MPTPPQNPPARTYQTQTKDDLRPSTHKTQTEPKVSAKDEGKRYSVINTKNDESFGSGMPLLQAKKLASSLSSSHRCRTAKVVEDAPAHAPTVARAAVGIPPAVVMAGAAAVAQKAAQEAQARHDQLAAENAAKDRIQASVNGAIAANAEPIPEVEGDLPGSDLSDVDVEDLLDGTQE